MLVVVVVACSIVCVLVFFCFVPFDCVFWYVLIVKCLVYEFLVTRRVFPL